MNVRRIGYLGLRTPQVERMTWFFRDVLGLSPARTDDTISISALPSGRFDYAEVYSPEFRDKRMIPDDVDGIAVAFVVDDLRSAVEEVKAAGLELIGDVVWAADAFKNPALAGVCWFWLRAPDGRTYVIEQSID